MSKHTFTPGPWEWDGEVWSYDADEEAPWLVQAPWTSPKSKSVLWGSIRCQTEADARLIAAAPELLQSLAACTDWMERVRASGDAGYWDWDEDSEYSKAVSIIAKATGGDQ